MHNFQEIDLDPKIQQALVKMQFEKPTEVQQAVIPVVSQGKDVLTCAETGSGKTAAYAIPMVNRLLKNSSTNALILSPTRELAQQIADFVRDLTSDCEDLKTLVIVGGHDINKQIKAIKKKPRIIVATPGRLNDHLERGTLRLKNSEILVLDEGDRMLDMGFEPQLIQILKFLPEKRQSSLFTATLSKRVKNLSSKYLIKATEINIGRVSLPVESVKQSVRQLLEEEKKDKLLDELNQREGSIIVFIQTKRNTDKVTKFLKSYGVAVDLIHGGRSQRQRNKAIKDFRSGKSRILCATDVAARGIDIPSVGHVINFDLPRLEEDYVHRIGRTARNGAEGEAVSFVTPMDHYAWLSLSRKYKIQGVELEGVKKSLKQPKENIRSRARKSAARSERGTRSANGRARGNKSEGRRSKNTKSFSAAEERSPRESRPRFVGKREEFGEQKRPNGKRFTKKPSDRKSFSEKRVAKIGKSFGEKSEKKSQKSFGDKRASRDKDRKTTRKSGRPTEAAFKKRESKREGEFRKGSVRKRDQEIEGRSPKKSSAKPVKSKLKDLKLSAKKSKKKSSKKFAGAFKVVKKSGKKSSRANFHA